MKTPIFLFAALALLDMVPDSASSDDNTGVIVAAVILAGLVLWLAWFLPERAERRR